MRVVEKWPDHHPLGLLHQSTATAGLLIPTRSPSEEFDQLRAHAPRPPDPNSVRRADQAACDPVPDFPDSDAAMCFTMLATLAM